MLKLQKVPTALPVQFNHQSVILDFSEAPEQPGTLTVNFRLFNSKNFPAKSESEASLVWDDGTYRRCLLAGLADELFNFRQVSVQVLL